MGRDRDMTADFSWNKALNVLGWCSDTLNRAAGWPGIFTPESLAKLQFPREGSPSEQTQARWDHDALLKALRASIEAGALPVATRTRTVDITESRRVTNYIAAHRDRLRGIDRPPAAYPRDIKVKVGEGTETSSVIERAAFRDFLAAQGIKPSEHVSAWLAPLKQTEDAHQEEAAPLTEKRRAAVIHDLGRRYPALAAALDRPEAWAKACRVPNRRGWYYLEHIEAQCRARYGGAAPVVAPSADLSPAGQLHRIGQ